jgi:hypothetical protein
MMMRRQARGVCLLFASLCLSAVLSGHAEADKIKHSIAVFSGLDKITGRIISFEVGMSETVQFGSLLITDRVCYTRPPTEAPQTDTFVQVDVVDADKTTKRIFSGWMFAASPGLNALDQPVYDIWLTGCKGSEQLIASPPTTASTPEPEAAPDATATPPAAPDNSDAAAAAPKPAKPPHGHHKTKVQSEGAPVDVGPPPGMQMPPDHGRDNGGDDGDRSPPQASPDDQFPPNN